MGLPGPGGARNANAGFRHDVQSPALDFCATADALAVRALSDPVQRDADLPQAVLGPAMAFLRHLLRLDGLHAREAANGTVGRDAVAGRVVVGERGFQFCGEGFESLLRLVVDSDDSDPYIGIPPIGAKPIVGSDPETLNPDAVIPIAEEVVEDNVTSIGLGDGAAPDDPRRRSPA